uniref:Uncharacterized protein n=1 Tax=Theileria annulata TaxID=5874 RepID=A0A3B0MHD5_THEAN
MNLIITLFAILIHVSICLDPVDIELLQPLPEEGIVSEEVTFHGIHYQIIVPLGQYYFRTISYNNNPIFQEAQRACLKVVIVTSDHSKYIFLRIITEDGFEIIRRYSTFGLFCFLERITDCTSSITDLIAIANSWHHSLNNRGFNIPLADVPFEPVGGPDDDQGPGGGGPDDDDDDDHGPPGDVADQPPQPPGDDDADSDEDSDNGGDNGEGGAPQDPNQIVQDNNLEPGPQDDIPILIEPDHPGGQDAVQQVVEIGPPSNSPYDYPYFNGFDYLGFDPEGLNLGENELDNPALNQPILQEDLEQLLGQAVVEDDFDDPFDVNIIDVDQNNQLVPGDSEQPDSEANENGFYDFDVEN